MEEVEEFRRYLRKRGKKSHVVDDLIKRCDVFESFLSIRKKLDIDEANEKDILAFFESYKRRKIRRRNYLRAIGLYFKFKSKPELSALANNLRRQKISSTRNSFEIRNFRGINPKHATRLAALGIRNAEQLLELGKTRIDRQNFQTRRAYPQKQY